MSRHTPIPSGGEETPSTTPGTPFNETLNGSALKHPPPPPPSLPSSSKKKAPAVAAKTGLDFLPEGVYRPRYIDV